MKSITDQLGTLYHPVKAIVIYQAGIEKNSQYVEAYDMDAEGYPINAHPLSVRESSKLAKALDTSEELKKNYLKPDGIIPKNLLYVSHDSGGYAVWFTPAQKRNLLFTAHLGIGQGEANVPALIWKASKEQLNIYAIKNSRSVNSETALYHAPFFNVYADAKVCMGTVDVSIKTDGSLQDFMATWEGYFFNSFFSHTIQNSPTKGNIVGLWKGLLNTSKKFPLKQLRTNGKTLNDILK